MALFSFCEVVNIKDYPNSSTNQMILIKYISGKSLIPLPVHHSFFFQNLIHDWIIHSVILNVVIALYCRSFNQIVYWNFRKVRFIVNVYALLWKRGDLLFCICRSVCRRCLVRSISFNPFDWELQQWLPLESNFQFTQVKLLVFIHVFFAKYIWPLRLRVVNHKVIDPK